MAEKENNSSSFMNVPKSTLPTPDNLDPRKRVKSHSITGMMMNDDESSVRPHQQMTQLTYAEKNFLIAVERGDVPASKRELELAKNTGHININCADPLGRSGLLMAIDNENFEMLCLLLEYRVETKDALLHAISEEYVEAVESLLDHEAVIHKPGEPHSWEALPPETATFTSDITPLTLAAHRDNYEIIKLLLDRGATLPMPHDIRCGCEECVTARQEDSLRHSRSRINSYRALASPSLIALSSKDPILTAFELSWELRRLFFAEHEFKAEYMELRQRLELFATSLLDHTRGSYELEVLLNHDPNGPAFEHGDRMHLNRLKLAIKFRQKKFVAHPNVQQLLASIWYEGLPGFRRKNMALQALEVIRIGILFPVFSLSYIIAPHSSWGQTMRKPFLKFICHSASYFTFLFLLILASQRFETFITHWFGSETLAKWVSTDVTTKRGAPPSFVEWFVLAWVCGLIWSEIKQLWDVGLQEYAGDMWNILDFVTNSLYIATIALRIVAHYQVQKEKAQGSVGELSREEWTAWDPMLIAEGLFAAANIFSSLKLVFIFSVNPYLGPLQISLGRMVMDIMKFFFLYILVVFAFSCGMNQLLWYYADLESKRCDILKMNQSALTDGKPDREPDSCILARRFSNLFEVAQTLFWIIVVPDSLCTSLLRFATIFVNPIIFLWAVFGLVELESFELAGIKSFTRFWGMLMFGCFSVINIVVLLNLLIAMMNHSYQLIFEKADVEWKFARSKLWISYFEEGATVPPPFNIIPTPKTYCYMFRWMLRKFCRFSNAAKIKHIKTIRKKVQQQSQRDVRYQNVIRNLVRRYVTSEQRQADNQGVTEDDVNEIKQDISAFRCEILEVLKNSGMSVPGAGQGYGGKKNRQRERRLMKGFNITPSGPSNSSQCLSEVLEIEVENETVHFDKKSPKNKLARLARMAGAKKEMSKKKWGTLIDAATKKGEAFGGRSRSEDSVCSNYSQGSSSVVRKLRHQSTTDPGGSNSSVNQERRSTSQSGKTKRERFARSRSGITLPISMHLARLKFRDSAKTASGISQSLDAGDQSSEINDSFEEVRPVKRTSSAPSGEDSCTPPIPSGTDKAQSSTSTMHPVPIFRDTIPEIRYPSPSTSGDMEMPHTMVQVESTPKHGHDEPELLTKPNSSTTSTSGGTKLQGIIQPLKTSSPHSGWL